MSERARGVVRYVKHVEAIKDGEAPSGCVSYSHDGIGFWVEDPDLAYARMIDYLPEGALTMSRLWAARVPWTTYRTGAYRRYADAPTERSTD